MRSVLLKTLVSTLFLFCLVNTASATTYLVYFDVSSSVRKDHKNYLKECIRFAERFKGGDKVIELRLDANTLQFNPFRTVSIDKANPALSAEANKRKLAQSISNTYAKLDSILAESDDSGETSILGAFVTAGDYFNQENIPQSDRALVIFTDGIEESRYSGIFMRKKIPASVSVSKLRIPADLQARVFMLGIDPKQLKSDSYSLQKGFWEDAVKSSGSELVIFQSNN